MTIREAIRILDPETTVEALGEIKYYGGLNGRAKMIAACGEVADEVKKSMFQGHPFRPAKVAEELGDVLWYAALLADLLSVPLEKVMEMNIDKLRRRYPDGFSERASRERTE